VTIPSDIVGATQDAAKKRLQEEGLTGVYVEEEYSDYPAGTVSRVDPSPGAKVEKGSQVRYWISIGPEPSEPEPSGPSGTEGGEEQEPGSVIGDGASVGE
jgi:serine/threonine-protein kinase